MLSREEIQQIEDDMYMDYFQSLGCKIYLFQDLNDTTPEIVDDFSIKFHCYIVDADKNEQLQFIKEAPLKEEFIGGSLDLDWILHPNSNLRWDGLDLNFVFLVSLMLKSLKSLKIKMFF